MIRMNNNFLVSLLIIIGFFISESSFAQTISDPPISIEQLNQIKIEDLSDEQIAKIITEIEKKGVSLNEVETIARVKGVSSSQISLLKSRIEEVKLNGIRTESNESKNINNSNSNNNNEYLEQRIENPENENNNSQLDRIFGAKLFSNKELTFEPNLNIPTPKNYQLGSGDEIVIDIWGASQQTYKQEITRDGNINIEGLSPIYVNGLTLEEARKKIIKALSSIYQGLKPHRGTLASSHARISLGRLRSIKVSIIGEVNNPGTYTLPSMATAFNALYLSGGPSINGSFRNIQIIRNNKIYKTVDIYEFLRAGKGNNTVLREQDIINIPPFETRVALDGEFKIIGLFETKKEESLSDLIEYAGGFTADAYTHRLEVHRRTSREKLIADVSENEFSSFKMQNGDSVLVREILDRYANRVALDGAVYRTGNFSIEDNLTLKTLLLEKGEGLRQDAFLNRALLSRQKADLSKEMVSINLKKLLNDKIEDVILKPEDSIYVYSIFDLKQEEVVKISGEVDEEGEYPYASGMVLEDLIAMAGGFNFGASGAKVEISRITTADHGEKTGQLSKIFFFNVDKELEIENGEEFELMPHDEVYIRKSPDYEDPKKITINGEVLYPGDYSLSRGEERISELLERAGGLTKFAYIEGASLKRRINLSPTEILKREQLIAMDSTLDSLALRREFETISINLKSILDTNKKKFDLILKDGDEFFIPNELQTVSISGEVLNPSGASFTAEKRAKHYINSSGGFSSNARKRKTYVVYADGSAARTKHFILFKKYPKVKPGSKVIVPKKPDNKMKSQTWVSLAGAITSTLGLIVVAIIGSKK